MVGDSLADFYMERVDVALRYGEPEDSSMVAFKIARLRRIVCASPTYLHDMGEPLHPNELGQHNCLLYRVDNRLYDQWPFTNNLAVNEDTRQKKGAEFSVKVKGNRESNDADLVRRWCVSGKGIAFKSQLDMADDLHHNRLVEVLQDFSTQDLDLYLICASRQQVTPAVLLLRDLLREKISQMIVD